MRLLLILAVLAVAYAIRNVLRDLSDPSEWRDTEDEWYSDGRAA